MENEIIAGVIQQGVTATGLSRLLKHLDGNYGVVSAYLDVHSDKENKTLHVQLKKDIRALGYGFIELSSYWEEEGEVTPEVSLFVPGISKKEIIQIGVKYKQHSVLSHVEGENCQLIRTNDNKTGKIEIEFSKHVLSEKEFKGAYSSLKKGGKNTTNKNLQLVSLDRPHSGLGA